MNLNDEVKALEEVKSAIASDDPEKIARALMSNIWPLYSAHFDLLTSATEGLPGRLLERYPVLRAAHRMTPVLARTSRPFKPLIDQNHAKNMDPDELDFVTLVQMMAFRFSGDVPAALNFARRLDERILHRRSERTDGPLWYYHHQIGSTLLLAGDSSRALVEFGIARQVGKISNQLDAERLALGRTALAHAVRGSIDYAAAALAEITDQPLPTAAHVVSSVRTERTAAALIGVERMEDNMDGLLAELEPHDSIQLTWPFALLARARWLVAGKRPSEALETIQLADNAHPAQQGSFVSDIVTSTSIDALVALGDTRAAWRLAEANVKIGKMTKFATIRLALQDSRFDIAAQELRRLASGRTNGPGQQAESVLLSAWLEVAKTGSLDNHRAAQVSYLAARGNVRRLLATIPGQVVQHVMAGLSSIESSEFDMAIVGLRHIDMRVRPTLTPSEHRVLNALTTYETTAAIAAAFHVSPNTIKSQLKGVYRKLECSTREDAIRIASRHRLIVGENEDHLDQTRI